MLLGQFLLYFSLNCSPPERNSHFRPVALAPLQGEKHGTSTSTASVQCELPPADENVDEEPFSQQAASAKASSLVPHHLQDGQAKGFSQSFSRGHGSIPRSCEKTKDCQRAHSSSRQLCHRVLNEINQTSSEVFQ